MSSLFKRNLNRCGQSITLQNRDIVEPLFGEVDFDEDFSGDTTVKSLVKTVAGKTVFDGVGLDDVPTHIFCIEYLSGVTDQTWILFKGSRYDILEYENCCEQDEKLKLYARLRGTGEASKA